MDSYSWFSDVDKLEAVQLLVFISNGGYEPQYRHFVGKGSICKDKGLKLTRRHVLILYFETIKSLDLPLLLQISLTISWLIPNV